MYVDLHMRTAERRGMSSALLRAISAVLPACQTHLAVYATVFGQSYAHSPVWPACRSAEGRVRAHISRLHTCTLALIRILPCRERRCMHVLSRRKDRSAEKRSISSALLRAISASFLHAKLTWRCTRPSLGGAMLTPRLAGLPLDRLWAELCSLPVWPACRSAEGEVRALYASEHTRACTCASIVYLHYMLCTCGMSEDTKQRGDSSGLGKLQQERT